MAAIFFFKWYFTKFWSGWINCWSKASLNALRIYFQDTLHKQKPFWPSVCSRACLCAWLQLCSNSSEKSCWAPQEELHLHLHLVQPAQITGDRLLNVSMQIFPLTLCILGETRKYLCIYPYYCISALTRACMLYVLEYLVMGKLHCAFKQISQEDIKFTYWL